MSDMHPWLFNFVMFSLGLLALAGAFVFSAIAIDILIHVKEMLG